MNFDYAREIELTVLINCSYILQFEAGVDPGFCEGGSESRVDLEGKLTLIFYL